FWKRVEQRRQTAEDFAAEISKLSPEEQVAAVHAKLVDLNGEEAIGELRSRTSEGGRTDVTLVLTDGARDITPLMAISRLKALTLTGGPYWLDISAVKNLPLEELTCSEDIAFKNVPVLREMETLTTINGRPRDEYLDGLTTKSTNSAPTAV
ncbi:MAG: hypothetical protein KY475_06855, partial [Planctomycetes bacterium]|nr:hypothetical protein [Planctomycetota bacterium]